MRQLSLIAKRRHALEAEAFALGARLYRDKPAAFMRAAQARLTRRGSVGGGPHARQRHRSRPPRRRRHAVVQHRRRTPSAGRPASVRGGGGFGFTGLLRRRRRRLEPLGEFGAAAVARRRRGLGDAAGHARRAFKAHVEMVVVALPRPQLAQPGGVAAGGIAKLAILAPPIWYMLTLDQAGKMIPSAYARPPTQPGWS